MMEVRDKYAPSAHMSGVPEGSKSDYPFGRFCFSVDRTKRKPFSFRHSEPPSSSATSLGGEDVCFEKDSANVSGLDLHGCRKSL